MSSPTQAQVGFLLPLTCGHNRHPNTVEQMLIAQHLDLAGFLDPVDVQVESEDVISVHKSPTKPLASQLKQKSKAEEEKKGDDDEVKEPTSGDSFASRSSISLDQEEDDGESGESEDDEESDGDERKVEDIVEEEVRGSVVKLNAPDVNSDSEKMVSEGHQNSLPEEANAGLTNEDVSLD